MNELGYTLTNTSKEAGFITATKQTSGMGTKLLTGSEYHDQLTISIFGDSASGRKIRATAGRTDRKSNLFGTSSQAMKPSEAGKADANALLQSCADGSMPTQGLN
ncbi:hypothetical protein rosag_12280 [Roseisolibacter agri]|uniref:Uncharacterized protein n=1 Tax=Roseisolibacter agri TaxID=2014610 RepID=A0AA37V0L1_9BACT|nr:hypothetical protein rosag_12280 [Roseisolibacter agri]